MAVCPFCGNKRFGLPILACSTCNRPGCENCLRIPVSTSFPDASGKQVTSYTCSWECFERAVTYHMSRGQTVQQYGSGYVFMGRILMPEAAWRVNRHYVDNLVMAKRYDDAARLYEQLGMWREAGDMRDRSRHQYVTHVQVNLNDLLEQLSRMGLSASYTCPQCRSPIKITGETNMDSLTRCQYCGATIRQSDIVDAVMRVVSPR